MVGVGVIRGVFDGDDVGPRVVGGDVVGSGVVVGVLVGFVDGEFENFVRWWVFAEGLVGISSL